LAYGKRTIRFFCDKYRVVLAELGSKRGSREAAGNLNSWWRLSATIVGLELAWLTGKLSVSTQQVAAMVHASAHGTVASMSEYIHDH